MGAGPNPALAFFPPLSPVTLLYPLLTTPHRSGAPRPRLWRPGQQDGRAVEGVRWREACGGGACPRARVWLLHGRSGAVGVYWNQLLSASCPTHRRLSSEDKAPYEVGAEAGVLRAVGACGCVAARGLCPPPAFSNPPPLPHPSPQAQAQADKSRYTEEMAAAGLDPLAPKPKKAKRTKVWGGGGEGDSAVVEVAPPALAAEPLSPLCCTHRTPPRLTPPRSPPTSCLWRTRCRASRRSTPRRALAR